MFAIGVVLVPRLPTIVLVSLRDPVRLFMLTRGLDVRMMSGSGMAGTTGLVAESDGDAFRGAQQRTHEPKHRTRPCDHTECAAEFWMSRCRHVCYFGNNITPSRLFLLHPFRRL